MSLENLKELLNHPSWQSYLDLLEDEYLQPCMMELFTLEPTKPENFVKFVQLKTRMDTIRDITYILEIQLVEDQDKPMVADSYTKRIMNLLKRTWRKDG